MVIKKSEKLKEYADNQITPAEIAVLESKAYEKQAQNVEKAKDQMRLVKTVVLVGGKKDKKSDVDINNLIN